jgi:importin-7
MELARACRSIFQLLMLMLVTIFVERKAIEDALKEDSDDDDDAEIGDSLNLADDDGAFFLPKNLPASFLLLILLLSISLAPLRKYIYSEQDVWDEDSEYIEMLAKEGARLREKNGLGAGTAGGSEEDEEEDSDDEEEIDEELGYISPLEPVDPYVQFKQALTSEYLFLLSSPTFVWGFMTRMIDVPFFVR